MSDCVRIVSDEGSTSDVVARGRYNSISRPVQAASNSVGADMLAGVSVVVIWTGCREPLRCLWVLLGLRLAKGMFALIELAMRDVSFTYVVPEHSVRSEALLDDPFCDASPV